MHAYGQRSCHARPYCLVASPVSFTLIGGTLYAALGLDQIDLLPCGRYAADRLRQRSQNFGTILLRLLGFFRSISLYGSSGVCCTKASGLVVRFVGALLRDKLRGLH